MLYPADRLLARGKLLAEFPNPMAPGQPAAMLVRILPAAP